jgi:hypothetical protein
MSLRFKMMRSASGYQPGKTLVAYEKLAMHHAATVPVYETYERVITSMGARGLKLKRTVTKIRYGADGKTPLRPLMQLIEVPGGDPAKPEKVHVPQSQLIPIAAPVRLKKGSPKALYRLLKKLERTVGLDKIYAQMAREAA